MAAPTNAAYVQESPCQLGAVHTWGKADIALCTAHVLLTQSGHYLFLQPPLPVCSFDDDTIPCLEPHGAHPAARAHHAIRWGGSREELGACLFRERSTG